MIDGHQTAQCPWCGRDSYEADSVAWFSTAKCMWCKCEFKYDKKAGDYSLVVVKPGNTKQAR